MPASSRPGVLLTFDFGVIYYAYPGFIDPGADPDYLELKAGVSGDRSTNFTARRDRLLLARLQRRDRRGLDVEGTAAYTLPTFGVFTPTVSGFVGYQDSEDAADGLQRVRPLHYWNAGLALTVEKLTFDFRYWDTDARRRCLARSLPDHYATSGSCSARRSRSHKPRLQELIVASRGRAIGPDLHFGAIEVLTPCAQL